MNEDRTSNLETLDEKGNPPKSRVTTYLQASTIAEQMIEDGNERDRKGARIQGMFDGNPPFNPAKLRANGMGHYPNFNSLEGKAYSSNACVPYYDLVSGGNSLVEVSLDIRDTQLQTEWSRITSEELERTMKVGTWFENTMWPIINDFVNFGKGFPTNCDPSEWRFEHVPWNRFYFPKRAKADPKKWDRFTVVWEYEVHDLYKRIRNASKANQMGWQVAETLYAIRNACVTDDSNNEGSQIEWGKRQQELRDSDMCVSATAELVETAWLFIKEFDGKWSWYVIPRKGKSGKVDPAAGFLYKKVGAYADVSQIVNPLFFEVNTQSVNGLSGLGKDIFSQMQVKDRLNCAMANAAAMRSSLVLSPKTGTARQKAAVAQIGNLTVLPEGYEAQQSQILGDIESSIVVGADFDRRLQSNTGIYRPQFEKPQGNPETATAAQLRFTQGTVLGNSAVNRFHSQLDKVYEEMYRRLCKSSDPDARKFRQWCNERGVPTEVLSKVRSVRSYRTYGNGNAFLRQQNVQNLLPVMSEFPEPGKRAFVQDIIATFTNQQKVDRYMPKNALAQIPDRQVWEALQEQADFKVSAPVTWTPEQDDDMHLKLHAEASQAAHMSLQQGGNPHDVVLFVQNALANASQHIQSLQRKGRKQSVKQWGQIYQQIATANNKLASEVQKMDEQQAQLQQQAQQVTSELQLKEMQTKHRMALSEQKQKHKQAMDEQQAVHDARIKEFTTGQDMKIKNAQAIQELNVNAAKATQELVTAASKADEESKAPKESKSKEAKSEPAVLKIEVAEKPVKAEGKRKVKFTNNSDGSMVAEDMTDAAQEGKPARAKRKLKFTDNPDGSTIAEEI